MTTTCAMLALIFYFDSTTSMGENNIRRSLELKTDIDKILDSLSIGVIKVTPQEDAFNKVHFCNRVCFNMLKSFLDQ